MHEYPWTGTALDVVRGCLLLSCFACNCTLETYLTVKLPTYLPDLRVPPSHETEVALRAPAGRAYTSDIGHDWLVTD